MRQNILLLSLVVWITSCSKLGEYNFQPIPKVNLKVVLYNLNYKTEDSKTSTFLYFNYEITNESKSDVHFNFDSIKVQFNGNVSSRIYFNSIASVIASRKKLKNGENIFPLYAVFNDSVVSKSLNSFNIISYGFVK